MKVTPLQVDPIGCVELLGDGVINDSLWSSLSKLQKRVIVLVASRGPCSLYAVTEHLCEHGIPVCLQDVFRALMDFALRGLIEYEIDELGLDSFNI